MTVRKFFLLLQIGIFGLSAMPSAVNASTSFATGTMTVNITVNSSCTVSATGMSFGAYNLAQLNATSTISVTCTNGTTWAAGLGTGSGSYTTRKMTSGVNSLNYNLYNSAAKTQVWGDGSGGTGVVSGTGTGLSQTITVYGTVPSSQPTIVGSYSDAIVVVVSFV